MQHTFESLVESRREDGRWVNVIVIVADDDVALAKRVASILAPEDGDVVGASTIESASDFRDGDVLVWTPGDIDGPLRRRIIGDVAGATVVYNPRDSDAAERLADVRIERVDGEIQATRLLRFEYEGETYERKLAGFTGPAVETTIICEDCGLERPTSEPNPTLVNCRRCGSYNLSYVE